jgi:hypothetical protein
VLVLRLLRFSHVVHMSVGKLKHKYATKLKALEKEQVSSSHSSTPHAARFSRSPYFLVRRRKLLYHSPKRLQYLPSTARPFLTALFINRKPLTIPQGPAVERAAAQAKIEQQLADLKVASLGVANVGA